jgi:hypothetical protein
MIFVSMRYEVGEFYTAKTYNESGYNFPEGEYKLKIIREGFPDKPVNDEYELVIAEEQWLEGLEETEQYITDMESNWFYFEFPENSDEIEYMWVPESVVLEVFK